VTDIDTSVISESSVVGETSISQESTECTTSDSTVTKTEVTDETTESVSETDAVVKSEIVRIDVHETGGIDGRDLEYNIYRENGENIFVFTDHDGWQESGTYHISDEDMKRILSVDYTPYLNASRDEDLVICDAVYTDVDFVSADGNIITIHSSIPELYDMLYSVKNTYEPVDHHAFPLSGRVGEYKYRISELSDEGTVDHGYYTDMYKQPDSPLFVYLNSGEHNTGGYDIVVDNIEADGSSVVITVRDVSPQPDAIVTQAFTYSCRVVEFTPRPETVIVKDVNGKQLDVVDINIAHRNKGNIE
jgi:hypothetical protein